MKKTTVILFAFVLVLSLLFPIYAESGGSEVAGKPSESAPSETVTPESDTVTTESQSTDTKKPIPAPVPRPHPEILSPGLRNIASKCNFRMSALAGEDIVITEEDFLRVLNKKDISEIRIVKAPDPAEGELTVSGKVLRSGDAVSGSDISKLEFTPAGAYITSSEFVFAEGDSEYEIAGKFYFLSESNSHPEINDMSVGVYVETFEALSYFGQLPGYDPDGDEIEYMITRYPEKGALRLDAKSGHYEYLPNEGFKGRDSFEYVIVDKYGAYARSSTVTVSVDSMNSQECFEDMADSDAYPEAVYLSREGIISGVSVGGKRMFLPKGEVTRGEFVSMLMKSANAEINKTTVHTVFSDDKDIPDSMKNAVAAAYELGYIDGEMKDGKLYFLPGETVTVAECASMIKRMLNISEEGSVPVFSESDSLSADAALAVNALSAVSLLPKENGSLSPEKTITREYCAKLLMNVRSYTELYVKK